MQVVGRDAAGRLQYRYTAAHDDIQADIKFARVSELHNVISTLDDAISRDSATDDTAASLLLVRHFGLRPGSDADTKAAVKAYGATTLQAGHVTQDSATGVTSLNFTGKKGIEISVSTDDQAVFDVLAPRLTGKASEDRVFATSPVRLRRYLNDVLGSGFYPKDIRTYHANAVALGLVASMDPPSTSARLKASKIEVIDAVAGQLGNTRAVTRSSYINPTVFAEWEAQLV